MLKKGTIVDPTFVEAPSTTKNRKEAWDPEAHPAKKSNTWHFGYKAHVGTDQDSGIAHTAEITAANVSDVSMTPRLSTDEKEIVHADNGYAGAEQRDDAVVRNKAGKKIRYKINRKPGQIRKLSRSGQRHTRETEHVKSSIRCKAEHIFGIARGMSRYRRARRKVCEIRSKR